MGAGEGVGDGVCAAAGKQALAMKIVANRIRVLKCMSCDIRIPTSSLTFPLSRRRVAQKPWLTQRWSSAAKRGVGFSRPFKARLRPKIEPRRVSDA